MGSCRSPVSDTGVSGQTPRFEGMGTCVYVCVHVWQKAFLRGFCVGLSLSVTCASPCLCEFPCVRLCVRCVGGETALRGALSHCRIPTGHAEVRTAADLSLLLPEHQAAPRPPLTPSVSRDCSSLPASLALVRGRLPARGPHNRAADEDAARRSLLGLLRSGCPAARAL